MPWHISSGSAGVLGLRHVSTDAPPTTAYVMLGERCTNNCAFCTQAAGSRANGDTLSRITWPPYAQDDALSALVQAESRGDVRRVCFQVTGCTESQAMAREALAQVTRRTDIPVCVSIAASSFEEISMLLHAGAQRVTLALDAATPELFARVKGRDWQHTWQLLSSAARLYPGHIGTHLIAGLGETEEQLLYTVSALVRLRVTIGLFAFTPVRGTRMEHCDSPPLESYRRVQVGTWLLVRGLAQLEDMRFDAQGRLQDYGIAGASLATLLGSGEAFMTAGCPDCNRPYYNEPPGGPLYNYPRALSAEESALEVAALLQSLDI